jgi:hypothetical protein
MTAHFPMANMTRDARIAGALYLFVIAGGLFAEAVVLGPLVVSGDPVRTAKAILANESTWRWGIGAHLLYLAFCGVVMYALLFRIFKGSQPLWALLAFVFGLTSAAIEVAAILQLFVPLALYKGGGALAAIGEPERQAMGYLAIQLYETGFGVALLFFSGFCSTIGIAILRSHLIPAVVGIMMILAGACYFGGTLATTVLPSVAQQLFPWILLPCLVGEASLALWLVAKGVSPLQGANRTEQDGPSRN